MSKLTAGRDSDNAVLMKDLTLGRTQLQYIEGRIIEEIKIAAAKDDDATIKSLAGDLAQLQTKFALLDTKEMARRLDSHTLSSSIGVADKFDDDLEAQELMGAVLDDIALDIKYRGLVGREQATATNEDVDDALVERLARMG